MLNVFNLLHNHSTKVTRKLLSKNYKNLMLIASMGLSDANYSRSMHSIASK